MSGYHINYFDKIVFIVKKSRLSLKNLINITLTMKVSLEGKDRT